MTRHNDCSVSPTVCPANIYATVREAREGENMSFTCSIAAIQASKNGIIFLCKDGIGIRMGSLSGSEDFTFILSDVKQQNSGNYSCVYSNRKAKASEINSTGITSLFLHVHSQPESGMHTLKL